MYSRFKKEKFEVGSSSFWIFSRLLRYIPCQLLTGGSSIIVPASSQLTHLVWTHTGLRAAMMFSGSQEVQSQLGRKAPSSQVTSSGTMAG